MAQAIIEKPELRFIVYDPTREGKLAAGQEIRRFFGEGNYDDFKQAGRTGNSIPNGRRKGVNLEIYDKVGDILGLKPSLRFRAQFWRQAMEEAVNTINFARGVLFADQERQATLTTNITWEPGSPATALERLTKPSKSISRRLREEQGLVLGIACLSAEELSSSDNGKGLKTLNRLNNFLEDQAFIGKEGETERYEIYSVHEPWTNRLVGFSGEYPSLQDREGRWVKFLNFPVRLVGVKDEQGELSEVIPVLYDPGTKDMASRVIKGMRKSWVAAGREIQNGVVETSAHVQDQSRFRWVVMGDRGERDRAALYLKSLLERFPGVTEVKPDHDVNPDGARPNRPEFMRWQAEIKGLKNPIEAQVIALEDWVSAQYHVGEFDENIGMHNGAAHEFHKLFNVAEIAWMIWGRRLGPEELKEHTRAASYEYATRLGRKERVYPSPYDREF